LELKINLYAPSNPIISEAHYKLSLALEFAQTPSPSQNKSLALTHLESAISSVKQRVQILQSQGKTAEAKDAQEMIDELSIKVDEMKNPPQQTAADVSAMFGGGGAAAGLGEVLQQKLVETLAGGKANDLTGLVRKKEKGVGEGVSGVGEKRKIEGDTVVGSPGKKVRVEDVEDEG
jgi:HAT1-interacting factor 1